jgi:oxygen-independent coproporphyrinogen-3 oxidase
VTRIAGGQSVVAEQRVLMPDERVEDALFTGLRLTSGLDLRDIHRRYGVDVWQRYGAELARFVDAGLVVHEPGRRLGLTRTGMLLANDVMVIFIGSASRGSPAVSCAARGGVR